jgi:hypothetical protein
VEKWLGHGLLVKAIMSDSKNARNKTMFAKQIPKFKWDKFEAEEVCGKRPKPDPNLLFEATKKTNVTARKPVRPRKPARLNPFVIHWLMVQKTTKKVFEPAKLKENKTSKFVGLYKLDCNLY